MQYTSVSIVYKAENIYRVLSHVQEAEFATQLLHYLLQEQNCFSPVWRPLTLTGKLHAANSSKTIQEQFP